jgi:Glycosyltransferases, probably involved in cell wall biogenesis
MQEKEYSIDLIIPTYRPDEKFHKLMKRLKKQTVKPNHIWIINTQVEQSGKSLEEQYGDTEHLQIINITREEFDHGGTRNYGASLSDSEFVMFMTQDAVPADEFLIENLLKAFTDDTIGVAYGRQLAGKNAGAVEQYTRLFNYPDQDSVKSWRDLNQLGIKTYFCSNVCSVYRKSVYDELGGFVTKTIFNEDMIMASKVIGAGYSIAYASGAKVVHSHKYTYWQQFTRNFDMAVSQRQYREIFESVKSESEGIKMIKQTFSHLLKTKRAYLIPDLILQSGFKYLGYKMGLNYEKLPKKLVVKCSMNKAYWKDK